MPDHGLFVDHCQVFLIVVCARDGVRSGAMNKLGEYVRTKYKGDDDASALLKRTAVITREGLCSMMGPSFADILTQAVIAAGKEVV